MQEFSSDARKIWSDVYPENTPELIQRLYMFERIGHKKAHMIARILVTEYGMHFDRRFIDVSEDRHVRRVFLRSGLVEKDDASIVIEVARWLRPKFPGILDLPTWTIAATKKSGGREWCTPKSPKCTECRINDVCGKRMWLQEKGF